MLKLNLWDDKWDLQVDICPCDAHFNDWIESNAIRDKTIYHFGTGTHHVVGIRQAENGSGNRVFGITASKEEYEAYIDLISTNARVARSYVAYFGDIYLTNARLLPEFDVVTLFHLCEFFHPNTASAEYGGITDARLLDLMTEKTRAGGYILFYTRSKDYDAARPVIAAWEKARAVETVGTYKTLLVYRKGNEASAGSAAAQ